MSRITSLAGARTHFVGEQRVRLLRIYLGATTFLYTYGVVFTIFPVRTDLAATATRWAASSPSFWVCWAWCSWPSRRVATTFATAVADHRHTGRDGVSRLPLTAEYVCLIAPMFLAVYIRAFHPSRQAWALIGVLILLCVAAVAVAPAPHVGVHHLLDHRGGHRRRGRSPSVC